MENGPENHLFCVKQCLIFKLEMAFEMLKFINQHSQIVNEPQNQAFSTKMFDFQIGKWASESRFLR